MITVLVVAPSAAGRARLAGVLAADRRLHVVVGVPGSPLSRDAAESHPDVVLVDLGDARTPPRLRVIADGPPPVGVVFLAEDPRGAVGDDPPREGGWAVLPRHATGAEISAAIEAAATGLIALHPETAFVLRTPSRSHEAMAVARQALTAREIEVLGMIAEGLGNKAIAARLGISGHTVKFHIAAIFAKLEAGSRTEAVTIGLRRGLIMI